MTDADKVMQRLLSDIGVVKWEEVGICLWELEGIPCSVLGVRWHAVRTSIDGSMRVLSRSPYEARAILEQAVTAWLLKRCSQMNIEYTDEPVLCKIWMWVAGRGTVCLGKGADLLLALCDAVKNSKELREIKR